MIVERINSIKSHKISSIPKTGSEYENIENEVLAFFPQPKYFQVHFQHCHEKSDEIQHELQLLRDHVVDMEEKLEQMMKILDKSTVSF